MWPNMGQYGDIMTDAEIELAVTKAGGKWNGDTWKFEDADLHPFVRQLLAAERERCAKMIEDYEANGWHGGSGYHAGLKCAARMLRS